MSRIALKVTAIADHGQPLSVADLRGWLELWDAAVTGETDENTVYPTALLTGPSGGIRSIMAELPGYGSVEHAR